MVRWHADEAKLSRKRHASVRVASRRRGETIVAQSRLTKAGERPDMIPSYQAD